MRRVALVVALGAAFLPHRVEAAPEPSPEVREAMRFAVAEWNPKGGYPKMRAVSKCESTWNPRATNGSHDGLFQHKRKSWAGRVDSFNRHVALHNDREPNKLEPMAGDRWSALDQSRLTAALVAGVLPGYKGGWSWWECA